MSKRVLISHETLSNAVQMVKDKYQQSNGMTITEVETMVKEAPTGTEQSENITAKSSSCCEGTKFITSDGLKSIGDSPITLVNVEGLVVPFQPPADGLLWSEYSGVVGTKDNLIAYSGLSQLYRSVNGGLDWHRVTDNNTHSFMGGYNCPGGNFQGLAYNGVDTYVGCHYAFDDFIYSKDNGQTWQRTKSMSNGNFGGYYAVSYCGNKFFAMNTFDEDVIAYSEDGINWTETKLPYAGHYRKVVWGDNKYVTIPVIDFMGNGGGQEQPEFGCYSYDGIEWFTMPLPAYQFWGDFDYVNNEFILCNPEMIYHSKDGIDWPKRDVSGIPEPSSWAHCVHNDNGAVILLAVNTYVPSYISYDNYTWQLLELPDIDDAGWASVIWDGEKFIAMSYNCFLMYSYDGVHWDNIHATYGINPYIKYYTLIKE